MPAVNDADGDKAEDGALPSGACSGPQSTACCGNDMLQPIDTLLREPPRDASGATCCATSSTALMADDERAPVGSPLLGPTDTLWRPTSMGAVSHVGDTLAQVSSEGSGTIKEDSPSRLAARVSSAHPTRATRGSAAAATSTSRGATRTHASNAVTLAAAEMAIHGHRGPKTAAMFGETVSSPSPRPIAHGERTVHTQRKGASHRSEPPPPPVRRPQATGRPSAGRLSADHNQYVSMRPQASPHLRPFSGEARPAGGPSPPAEPHGSLTASRQEVGRLSESADAAAIIARAHEEAESRHVRRIQDLEAQVASLNATVHTLANQMVAIERSPELIRVSAAAQLARMENMLLTLSSAALSTSRNGPNPALLAPHTTSMDSAVLPWPLTGPDGKPEEEAGEEEVGPPELPMDPVLTARRRAQAQQMVHRPAPPALQGEDPYAHGGDLVAPEGMSHGEPARPDGVMDRGTSGAQGVAAAEHMQAGSHQHAEEAVTDGNHDDEEEESDDGMPETYEEYLQRKAAEQAAQRDAVPRSCCSADASWPAGSVQGVAPAGESSGPGALSNSRGTALQASSHASHASHASSTQDGQGSAAIIQARTDPIAAHRGGPRTAKMKTKSLRRPRAVDTSSFAPVDPRALGYFERPPTSLMQILLTARARRQDEREQAAGMRTLSSRHSKGGGASMLVGAPTILHGALSPVGSPRSVVDAAACTARGTPHARPRIWKA